MQSRDKEGMHTTQISGAYPRAGYLCDMHKCTESLNLFKGLSQSGGAFGYLKPGRLRPRFLRI